MKIFRFMTFHTKLQRVQSHWALGSESRYLVLFDDGLFDKIFDKIKYLISEKSGIK